MDIRMASQFLRGTLDFFEFNNIITRTSGMKDTSI